MERGQRSCDQTKGLATRAFTESNSKNLNGSQSPQALTQVLAPH